MEKAKVIGFVQEAWKAFQSATRGLPSIIRFTEYGKLASDCNNTLSCFY